LPLGIPAVFMLNRNKQEQTKFIPVVYLALPRTQRQRRINKASIATTDSKRLPNELLTHVSSRRVAEIPIEVLVTMYKIYPIWFCIVTSLEILRAVCFV
jgi:hypothetical protein